MVSPPPSFINQDLRQRSFRQQTLQNAHFADCDLQGCDFSQADLRGATFVRCRTGYLAQRWAIAGLLLALLGALMFHAVSSLVFGTLGTLPGQAAWPYVVALHIALAIAAVGTFLRRLSWRITVLAQPLAGLAIAALMGFFYGGRLTDNNPTWALVGAISCGLLGGLIARLILTPLVASIVGLLGAIAAYGLAFLLWVSGSNLFTTGTWVSGLVIAAVAVVFVGVTFGNLWDGGRSLKSHAATSFRQADLRNCTFSATPVTDCDFTHAIRR
ncbi:MAG: pentapeptide repeat-containing protein [Cyanobacteria bacterium P01_D01_bin.115]